MRSISVEQLSRKMMRHCKCCRKNCKGNMKTIRVFHNREMSTSTAQIDIYCTNTNLLDFWPEKLLKRRPRKKGQPRPMLISTKKKPRFVEKRELTLTEKLGSI